MSLYLFHSPGLHVYVWPSEEGGKKEAQQLPTQVILTHDISTCLSVVYIQPVFSKSQP
jgi:hypothetical protein